MTPITTPKVPPFASRASESAADYTTERGAWSLADRIVEAWGLVGCTTVRAWAERAPGGRRWDVRTNLIRGLPPEEVQQ